MVRKIILIISCSFLIFGFANGENQKLIPRKKFYVENYSWVGEGFTHPGLFLFRSSLAVGGMTGMKVKNVFIEGNTEYFIDRKISLRGDGYFFATSYSDLKPFKMHHSLFTGAMFHKPTHGDFDPYLGLEMGINFAQATDACLGGTCTTVLPPEAPSKVFSPTLSPVIGFNYYGGRFFHLSMHARYIVGKFMDNYNAVSLGEWRISFGLGFNISKKLLNTPKEEKVIHDKF